MENESYDICIIGGGINGAGIARDAAGRGYSVCLLEAGDFSSGTSSASTKLLHGGLRYLEYFEFRLVREALAEREVLLRMMPHISWPMRFVLPLYEDMRFETDTPVSKLLKYTMPWLKGRRPDWLIRLGLFMYDTMGARKILPATRTLDLVKDQSGEPLQDKFKKAFEYSDCWVEDSRLVILNLRDAAASGASIHPRTKVTGASFSSNEWQIDVVDKVLTARSIRSKVVINAAGPWVDNVLTTVFNKTGVNNIRLVRGSHIVVKKKYEHELCYFFQNPDGRIIFAIPYEKDFTLIGTTDADHPSIESAPQIDDVEIDYLCTAASQYFKEAVSRKDIVWTYSGVRALFGDGESSAQSATRDYLIQADPDLGEGTLFNIFGGKITTFRKLAESTMSDIENVIGAKGNPWTHNSSLPGGDLKIENKPDGPINAYRGLCRSLTDSYPFLDVSVVKRLARQYGTDTFEILGNAAQLPDLGHHFGAGMYQAEVNFLVNNEWATTAEDILFRRTKQGIRMSPKQISELDDFLIKNPATDSETTST